MSVRAKLIGTWECLYLTATNAKDESDIIHPFTEHINGNIIYSDDGYMGALIQRPDIPKFTLGPLQGTAEQYEKASSGTQGYHGPFYLEEKADGQVKLFHKMIVSLPTNWTGETQVRWCQMWEEDGRLYMKLGPDFNITFDDGVERKVEVGWRKREANTRITPP
ncbi:hypothetical protein H2198_003885 [Neophaeococcomyces mojaviensis]|uniref:Uncharacterized protein n=1 Tax=Neophaeococcomyces mojaviensis TaxID=3383035 RepID=A0ACC3AA57_9EURO|nr:hypothetical protein H2198_003885 [Knufia sp. JES_112]